MEESFGEFPVSDFKQKFSDKNRTYKNKEELEEDLRMIFDIVNKTKGKPNRTINLFVITDEDKKNSKPQFC